jgi:outer membrane receptor protein involved in Fe transport
MKTAFDSNAPDHPYPRKGRQSVLSISAKVPDRRLLLALTFVTIPVLAIAQTPPRPDTTKATPLTEITVTATRSPKTVFRTASPVIVVDSQGIRRSLAAGPADLLRDQPGLDITGVGPNQARPVIRGERGQRVLLLEDGIRLNNTRRQQDFGEIPALIGLDGISRVEVVRGPASVLYGTDAIGGVMNLITTRPDYQGTGTHFRGAVSYRYSTSDEQQRPSGSFFGQSGRFGFGLMATYRDAGMYSAPSGTFGNLTLHNDTKVMDSGLHDENYVAQAGYGISEHHTVSAKYSRYTASDAGFGFVDNTALGTPDAASVQIRYPDQTWEKLSFQYRGTQLGLPIADRVDVTGYTSGNRRTLTLGVFALFGPGTPPGAGVQVNTSNYTDVGTIGVRAEAAKAVGRHVVTWGLDAFRDRSDNTDSSATTVVGFGPPQTQVDDTALTPNASFRSVGFFAQDEYSITDRLSAVAGARWQGVHTWTRATPQVAAPVQSSSDNTVVGALNLSYRVIPSLNLIASVGRAFRSPNLIERYFNGPTPEGSGYQVSSPGLKPETSLDVDLGVKVASGRVYAEGFVFRNDVRNGIAIAPTGAKIGPFVAYQNVNVDKLRTTGVELLGQVELGRGFSTVASYTHLSSKNVLDPLNPVGDSYSSKVTGLIRWREATGRFWASYDVRHNGIRKDVNLAGSPIGPVLPAFTVQDVRGGVRLFRAAGTTNELTFAVTNVANVLYAEFSNASFFRPEPKRSLAVAWTTGF